VVPRVECGEHGVVVAHVPWARPGAKHTRVFEDTCAWLAAHAAMTSPSRLTNLTVPVTEIFSLAMVFDAKWVSLYRLHHRMAEWFRVGNVFLLAGDAAHVHSPVGGQGMNTGIQDAYNHAWKLAMVINGQAGETLLDSYSTERMPVARALLNGTDKAFNVLVSDRKTVRLARKLGARLLHVGAASRRRQDAAAVRDPVTDRDQLRHRRHARADRLAAR